MDNIWFNKDSIITYAVSLLALAEIIDLTIVPVAIPQIMGSIGADLDSVAMVTTCYIVAAAVFMPLAGPVIKKFGMKRVILISAFLFTFSSILCGLATSLSAMLLFRVMQGIGGAFLPPVAQAYIAETYKGEKSQQMMTLWGSIIVMGPVIGPVLGGALTENYSWRWIFYVNVPICVISFLLILIFMRNDDARQDVKIDQPSFFFMAIGIGCLEYFLDQGDRYNWFESTNMVVIFAISLLSLFFFAWRGFLGKSVVNFKLFKNVNFSLCCFAMFCFMALSIGSRTYFPTMLQQVYYFQVDTAGYITVPRGVAGIVAALLTPLLVKKIGLRITMFLGVLIYAIACFIMANFGWTFNKNDIIFTMILQGFAMMAFFIPLMQACFIGFSDEESRDASGVFNFFRDFACSVGTSAAATIVSHQMQVNYHDLAKHVSPYSHGFSWWTQSLAHVPEQLQIAIAQAKMMTQGSLISYLDLYYFVGIALLLMLWVPFILKQPDFDTPPPHVL